MAAAQNGPISLDEILRRDPEFLREFWALYFLGMTIIILRFPVRIRMVGVKGLTPDDYVGIATLTAWLSCMTLVEQVHVYGTNVDVTQKDVDQLSEADIDRLIYGSKCQQGAWYCYTALLWSMKATILLFYKRLIGQLWQANVFKGLAWLTGLSYCAVVLTISFGCRPFSANWQVQPLPNYSCTFKLPNLLSTTALNILTDAVILILPVPVLKELNVNPVRKMFVMVLMCSGLFVIGAAVMRLVNTLGGEPSTVTVNRWGVRECVVGVIAINAPVLRPMFTTAFWCGQQRRDAGRAMEDRLAHPPRADLARRGFYKDSVLGWLKATLTTTTTWITTGTTAVTLLTTRTLLATRQIEEERPRDEENVTLGDVAAPTAPSQQRPVQGYLVRQNGAPDGIIEIERPHVDSRDTQERVTWKS